MRNNISLNRKPDSSRKDINGLASCKAKEDSAKTFYFPAKFIRDARLKKSDALTNLSKVKLLENELAFEKMKHNMEISETVLLVQQRERTRLGHELHDNVSQILSAAKLFIETLRPCSIKDRQVKNKTVEYILLAIEEIRKLSKKLVASQLNKKRFVENIQA
jgi:signal transduction histidine kinase